MPMISSFLLGGMPPSVSILVKSLDIFGRCARLKAKNLKSSFFLAGVDDMTRRSLLGLTAFF